MYVYTSVFITTMFSLLQKSTYLKQKNNFLNNRKVRHEKQFQNKTKYLYCFLNFFFFTTLVMSFKLIHNKVFEFRELNCQSLSLHL